MRRAVTIETTPSGLSGLKIAANEYVSLRLRDQHLNGMETSELIELMHGSRAIRELELDGCDFRGPALHRLLRSLGSSSMSSFVLRNDYHIRGDIDRMWEGVWTLALRGNKTLRRLALSGLFFNEPMMESLTDALKYTNVDDLSITACEFIGYDGFTDVGARVASAIPFMNLKRLEMCGIKAPLFGRSIIMALCFDRHIRTLIVDCRIHTGFGVDAACEMIETTHIRRMCLNPQLIYQDRMRLSVAYVRSKDVGMTINDGILHKDAKDLRAAVYVLDENRAIWSRLPDVLKERIRPYVASAEMIGKVVEGYPITMSELLRRM